jgi:hypothetical protein
VLARDSLTRDARPPARGASRAIAAWTLLGAAVRLTSLRALPVFGDEAIFLRLAALARRDPLARLWISFQEAQAPLHVWLLALVLPVSSDPVRAGRLLSVVVGIACVPASAWAARRVVEAFGQASSLLTARFVPVGAAALAALCPFFVFAGRLARVDALFLLESILAAGLAVTLAVAVGSEEARRARRLWLATAFGILMGATMLTRQAVSYPLWLLPPIAWALRPEPRRGASTSRLLEALAVAAAVAAALWLPMLAAPGEPDAMARLFHSSGYRPPMPVGERLLLTLRNVRMAAAALWAYLTPPVVLLAALGFLLPAGIAPARRRLMWFLLLWEGILLGPTAAFAASYFPRYALPAAVPFCVAAALGAAGVWERLSAWIRLPVPRAALAAGLAAAVLGPSILQLVRGERDWRNWRLLPIDREQFLSGPAAGLASEAAAGYLREAAHREPLVVLMPEISGNPTDTIWLLLGGEPRVTLSYAPDALSRPLLPPVGSDGARRLMGDARDRRAPLAVPAETPFFAVVPDPLLTRSGWVAAVPFLARLNPGVVEAARFRNPAAPGGRTNSVVVLRLRNPS